VRHDFAPRRVAELLDDAISLVKGDWRSVLGASAIVVLPAAAAYSIVASFYLRSIIQLFGMDYLSGSMTNAQSGPAAPMMITIIAMQGLSAVYALAKALFDATLYSSSAEVLEGQRLPVKTMLGRGLRSLVPVVVVEILVYMLVLVLGVALLAAGVFASIAFVAASPQAGIIGVLGAYAIAGIVIGVVGTLLSLSVPIVVIEGGIGTAMKRSFSLVRRHFWRVAFILVAIGALSAQFESALAAPTLIRELIGGVGQPAALLKEIAWGWKVFDGLMQGLAIAVVLPFSTSAMLLLYLDLRARDEGMDLLVRARALTPA